MSADDPGPSPVPAASLVRLTPASSKSCKQNGPRLIWFPARVAGACFRAPCSPDRTAVHQAVRVLASSFLDVSPLQSSFALTSVQHLSVSDSLPGFRPSSRCHQRASTHREDSNPRYVPSTGDHSLSTAYSALWFRGLFHPRTASRDSPVQGILAPHSRPPSREELPPCRWATHLSPDVAVQSPGRAVLDFEALLRAESRSHCAGDEPARWSLPSSGSLSSRSSFLDVSSSYPKPSTHDVRRQSFARALA